MDFFTRTGDEQRLAGATFFDDIDLLDSRVHRGPWGAEKVAVAMHQGQHICWTCGKDFREGDPKWRMVEIRLGFALVGLHPGCTTSKPMSFRSFDDLVRGHHLRRMASRAARAVANFLDPTAEVPAATSAPTAASPAPAPEAPDMTAAPATESDSQTASAPKLLVE